MEPEPLAPVVAPVPSPSRPVFVAVATSKLVILSIATFGIYLLFWQYRAWKSIQNADTSDIWPIARAFFAIFYVHALFKRIEEEAEKEGYPEKVHANSLAWNYIALTIAGNISARYDETQFPSVALFILALDIISTFVFVPFIYIQKPIIYMNTKTDPSYMPAKKYAISARIIAVVGIFLWVGSYVAVFFQN